MKSTIAASGSKCNILTRQGDATLLLRALLDAQLPPGTAAFGWVYDPEVLDQCFAAGVGQSIGVSLGGKADPTLGKAHHHDNTVKTITLQMKVAISCTRDRWRPDRDHCDSPNSH